MIAVWGSGGAGKKTFAAALAEKLARKKQNVIIINTSTTVPALPIFIPTIKDNSSNHSIGSLISSKAIDNNAMKGKIHIHPKSTHIGFMGLCSSETPITYKSFERSKIVELFSYLNGSAFDYIICVCESNPVNDPMTFLSLEISDIVFRLITPNVKGIEFSKAQCSWLKNGNNFRIDKQIKVCSMVTDRTPYDEVSNVIGSFDYALPFSNEVEDAFHAGELLSNFSLTSGIEYENIMVKIAEVIMNG